MCFASWVRIKVLKCSWIINLTLPLCKQCSSRCKVNVHKVNRCAETEERTRLCWKWLLKLRRRRCKGASLLCPGVATLQDEATVRGCWGLGMWRNWSVWSVLMRHQWLLWVSEIQGLQFTVILDRERQAITVSQSGRDGTLHEAELNSGVGTGGQGIGVRNFCMWLRLRFSLQE